MTRKSSLFLAASIALASPATAHDWYPMECCHGMDCAVVEKVEIVQSQTFAGYAPPSVGSSGMIVTSKHGTVFVPGNFPRRESKDNRMHVCMRPTGDGTAMKLLCIFMPPST